MGAVAGNISSAITQVYVKIGTTTAFADAANPAFTDYVGTDAADLVNTTTEANKVIKGVALGDFAESANAIQEDVYDSNTQESTPAAASLETVDVEWIHNYNDTHHAALLNLSIGDAVEVGQYVVKDANQTLVVGTGTVAARAQTHAVGSTHHGRITITLDSFPRTYHN